ncbi:prepilin-type N-terminal cleavage/methylation domain-containing protein [Hydrogenophaga soli]
MTAARRSPQHGLSLLELLVAFTIMALSLGLLYRTLGGGVRTVAELDARQQAAMVGESVLASRDSVTAQGWNESGVSGGFHWQVSSQPHATGGLLLLPGASGQGEPMDRVPLHVVTLRVSWQDGLRERNLDVQTLLPQRKPLPGEVAP